MNVLSAQMDLCGPNGKCVNTLQGYRCECDPGWVIDTSSVSREGKHSNNILIQFDTEKRFLIPDIH